MFVSNIVNIVKNAYENKRKKDTKKIQNMSIVCLIFVSNIVNIVKNAYASLVYMHVVHS